MGAYLVRRLFHTVLVVWGAITLLFLLVYWMPGDIIEAGGGEVNRQMTASVRENLERLYGLDKSMPQQYAKALQRVFTFDYGVSSTERDIFGMLKQAVVSSGRLSFWGLLSFSVLGTASGAIAAARRNGIFDRVSGFFSIFLIALPPFVMGILLQILLGVTPFQKGWPKWAQFPIQWSEQDMTWVAGVIPTGRTWKYLILPVVTLACVNIGGISRLARATTLETLRADYLRTAYAKGLSRSRVLFKHALRNSLIPVVTTIGTEVPNVLGFAILTETVWNIPGLGGTIRDAVFAQDTPLLLSFCSVVVLVAAVSSLLVDISYGFLDPRVRVYEQ